MTAGGRRVRLRGTTLLAAPLALVGVIGLVLAVATAIWGAWEGHEVTGAFWVTLAVSALVGAAGLVAARGCFVEVDDGRVRDVVAWCTVRAVDQRSVRTARVATGPWRWFVLEMDDGRRHTLVGASPLQWPARLLPSAVDRDLEDLDLLLGEDQSEVDRTPK